MLLGPFKTIASTPLGPFKKLGSIPQRRRWAPFKEIGIIFY
jgi:hypothetical protein